MPQSINGSVGNAEAEFDGDDSRRKLKMMTEIKLQLPESTALALKVPQEGLGDALLLAAAVKLYEIGKLSSGTAAELAGLPKPLFLVRLADYGVATFDLKNEELEKELALG